MELTIPLLGYFHGETENAFTLYPIIPQIEGKEKKNAFHHVVLQSILL